GMRISGVRAKELNKKYLTCIMPGVVGANLRVRPVISDRHTGLPLQNCTENGYFIFWGVPDGS
ncbi:MAG: hypothetical protein D3904_08195, partial [Candidatus Electrothrix sp. EH2]|nr:hypothetical protein [Candidatus Electrothrix sp. EH2]